MMMLKKAVLRFFDVFTRRHVLLQQIEELRERQSRIEIDLYRIIRQVDVTCEFYERRIDNIHQNVRILLEAESHHDQQASSPEE